MSKLIMVKTEGFQEKAEKEREILTREIKADIERNLFKEENKMLNEVKSSLMNHSRFVEKLFDPNPETVWKVEYQEKLDKVLFKANSMSGKVGKLESFLEQRSFCDHRRVGGLESDVESLSQKVDGFVMQNLKIVKMLPRRIESLRRRMGELEDKWLERRKLKHVIC